ncbi:hypothetical protein CANINC_004056 [Pichia inconspicua]|uniref:Ubiquitin carboxyl-terminal hydrolase n=1 Tax=Pichia inconspicua TaxID=52247 RepID=A0A4V4NFA1_9ASCO|nr:hypothetical protein CANINC_004056 [[Candida] inconspicua]
MIQQIPTNDLNIKTKTPFDEYLQINKKFTLSAPSKHNNIITHQFPLYFGTTEEEINPYRQSLFIKRKSIKDEQQKHLKALQLQKIKKSQSVKKSNDQTTTSPEQTKSSKIETSKTQSPHTPAITNTTSSISLADSLKRSQASRPATSVSPLSAAALRPKSIQRSNTQSPSTTSNPTFDTVSTDFNNISNKPLGITLLRIMFDSQYINKIYHPSNTSSIYPHGLQNSGNICYMNSILQFLFYCDPFTQILNIIRDNTIKELDPTKNNTPILNALLDLQDSFKLKPSAEANSSTINPNDFYTAISSLSRFSHLSWGRQEDAEELLNILLDGLHEEFIESIRSLSQSEVLNFANAFSNKETTQKIIQNVDFIKDSSKENASTLDNDSWNEVGSNMKTIGKRTNQVKLSPIVNLFGGQFKSVLKSSNKKSSITLDPFLQVQLDISDPDTIDLVTAFEKFAKDEEVQLGNTVAKKQNSIDKLPSILLIHLKRFSFVANDEDESEDGGYEVVSNNKKGKKNSKTQQQSKSTKSKNKLFDGHIEKIHKFIKYNHNLTLPKSCISTMISEEPNFKLLGVVYHHGRSTENGHYTTDVQTKDGDWIRIDDTNITKISPDDAISDQNLGSNINKTAYILMFQKV